MRTFVAGVIVICIALLAAAAWGYGVWSKEVATQRCQIDRVKLHEEILRTEADLARMEAELQDLQETRVASDRVMRFEEGIAALQQELEDLDKARDVIEQEIVAVEERSALEFIVAE